MSGRATFPIVATMAFAVVVACSGGGGEAMPTAATRAGVLPPGVVAFTDGAETSHRALLPGETMTDSTARIGGIGRLAPVTMTTPLGTPVTPTCASLVVTYQWRASPQAAADAMRIMLQPANGEAEELAPGPSGHGITGCAEFRIENRSSETLTIDLELRGGVRE